MCCCRAELQGAFGVSLSQGQTSGGFECPCDTTAVRQTGKDFQGFVACDVCSQMVPLRTVDVGQVCERPRGAPRISGFPEPCERTVIQSSSNSHVALCAGYVALLIDRPSTPGAITKFLE